MPGLQTKVQNALDESRILVLGAQVLLGFQYRGPFEPGFDRLSQPAQWLKLGSLLLMLAAVFLLMAPAAYHRIVAHGEDRRDVHDFIHAVMGLALLPIAAAIGVDFYVAVSSLASTAWAVAAGALAAVVALTLWYGIEHAHPQKRGQGKMEQQEETELEQKIRHLLTETRVVLPGAQAVLGFQFAMMLMDAFERLPHWLKWMHVASLGCVMLATLLLMTPAAYHRIVDKGELTERFHRFGTRMLTVAMAPLLVGLTLEGFVVLQKVTKSLAASIPAAIAAFLLGALLWFGYTSYRERQVARLEHDRA
jgi:Family of unknown function (DUF6328)